MITGEEWDTHWWRIYQDALEAGSDRDTACEIADDETYEPVRPTSSGPGVVTGDWRVGLVTEVDDEDWRGRLAAARSPTTPAQDRWDRDWRRWRDIALRTGRTQLDAIAVAYLRTEDQHGPRPSNEETKP